MKSERELFEEKYKELTDCDEFSLHRKKNGDYQFDGAYFGWLMWQASANRQGYKLVPLQPSRKIIVSIEKIVENQIEASGITQDPFRLDGEKIYKAMIGAVNEH